MGDNIVVNDWLKGEETCHFGNRSHPAHKCPLVTRVCFQCGQSAKDQEDERKESIRSFLFIFFSWHSWNLDVFEV